MSLYGSRRDVNLVKSLNRELLHNIIEQSVGFYKPKIDETKVNLYGEASEKTFIGPVLIPCLIDRGDQNWKVDEIPDQDREFKFRFLKDDLECANIVPEVGDIVLFNEMFFEIDGLIENQYFTGKDPDYSYSADSQTYRSEYGTSLSIILTGHYSRPERLGIKKERL